MFAVFQLQRALMQRNLDGGHADARYGVQTRVENDAVRDRGEDRRAIRESILQNDFARTAIFLAGGIGITPFRSIVHWAAKEKLPNRIVLFYSNRRPEDSPFLAELRSLEKDNLKYRLIASMTEMEKSHRAWGGEIGLINQEMLGRHLRGRSVAHLLHCWPARYGERFARNVEQSRDQ